MRTTILLILAIMLMISCQEDSDQNSEGILISIENISTKNFEDFILSTTENGVVQFGEIQSKSTSNSRDFKSVKIRELLDGKIIIDGVSFEIQEPLIQFAPLETGKSYSMILDIDFPNEKNIKFISIAELVQ